MSTAPEIQARDGAPAHATIARWLIELTSRGELVPGDRLPREDQFAALLGVSRMTLRQALATLETSGMVERKTGRLGGTVITEPRIDCDLTHLAGFTEQMRRAHVRAGAEVISAERVPANASAAMALTIRRRAPVYEIVRVRTVRREPLALERSYLPCDTFPDLLANRLTGSLYQLLARRYGQQPVSASESLEPVTAGQYEADLLNVPEGSPLMAIERTAYSGTGLPLEFARDLFRPDRIRISLRTGTAPQLSFKTS